MEVSQLAVFPFLGSNNSPCEGMGKSSSNDVSPCPSVDECHLFGGGDYLGSGLREIVESGHPPTWGIGVRVMDWWDDDDDPSRREYEEWRSSYSDFGAWCRTAWCANKKSWQLLFSTFKAHVFNSHIFSVCSRWSVAHWRDRSATFLLRALE